MDSVRGCSDRWFRGRICKHSGGEWFTDHISDADFHRPAGPAALGALLGARITVSTDNVMMERVIKRGADGGDDQRDFGAAPQMAADAYYGTTATLHEWAAADLLRDWRLWGVYSGRSRHISARRFGAVRAIRPVVRQRGQGVYCALFYPRGSAGVCR